MSRSSRPMPGRYLVIPPVLYPLLLLLLLLSSVSYVAAQQPSSVSDLWIDLRMGPPLLPVYNEVAREDDIARVDDPSQIGQLRATERGRRMVVFKSIAAAREALPDIASEIDIVGYNFESDSATPSGDLFAPVESIREMRALADSYGLQIAFGPDHDLALAYGTDIAPYVDIFVLQVQRQQTNPREVEAFVRPLIPALRAANPDLEISVQVRTEGDTTQIIELVDSLKEDLDGVSILTSPESVDTAQELVRGLRAEPALLLPGVGQVQNFLYLLLGIIIGVAGSYLIRALRRSG